MKSIKIINQSKEYLIIKIKHPMLNYFIIFNTKGVIIFEKGTAPKFRDNFITNIDINKLSGTESVRDINIFYKINGRTIYMLFTEESNCEALDKEIKLFEKPKEEVNESIEKEKDILDYSVSTIPNIEDTFEVKKPSFLRKFNLFFKEIKVSELKEKMKMHLINKNVAPMIAESFCNAIITDLEGKQTVNESEFRDKLQKIISNLMKSIYHESLIERIKEKKRSNQIFTFCFVGLNGVGKSTSLAKICCWLLQNNLKVFIAACDTFRAGAVEQLKVHFERFKLTKKNVGFYEKGYGEHETQVCKDAVITAKKEGYDVVLIDTAGRMHTNHELMQRLKKLIKTNNPDHIIFVGEALIGSESLDHLNEFNKIVGNVLNRPIDSLLITKVDTVDDKIGQIVNMTMAASAPVIFLGTGQKNLDLMKIDSQSVSDILMS